MLVVVFVGCGSVSCWCHCAVVAAAVLLAPL